MTITKINRNKPYRNGRPILGNENGLISAMKVMRKQNWPALLITVSAG
jgi:hypothetical protein